MEEQVLKIQRTIFSFYFMMVPKNIGKQMASYQLKYGNGKKRIAVNSVR